MLQVTSFTPFWLGACSLVPFWEALPLIQYSFWLGRGSLVPFLYALPLTQYPLPRGDLWHASLLSIIGLHATSLLYSGCYLLKLGEFITRYSLVLWDDRAPPLHH